MVWDCEIYKFISDHRAQENEKPRRQTELPAVICSRPEIRQMCLLLVASLDLVQATLRGGSRPAACCLDWSESEPARCHRTHQINVGPTRRLPNSWFEFWTVNQRLIPKCWSDGSQTQPHSWMSPSWPLSGPPWRDQVGMVWRRRSHSCNREAAAGVSTVSQPSLAPPSLCEGLTKHQF